MNNGEHPEVQPGRGRVSSHNFAAEVQSGYSFPQPMTIFDSTLRKIVATSGLRPTVDDMLHVAEALAEAGVREILYNINYWGTDQPQELEFEVGRAVLARDFGFHTSIFCGAFSQPAGSREAVDHLAANGMDTMIVPIGQVEGADREHQLEHLQSIFAYGKSVGQSVVLGTLDAGRWDLDHLAQRINEVIGFGALRIELYDSSANLSPEGMKYFVKSLRSRLAGPIPLVVHIHDDYGLASAAAIAAATAGAYPDVAVNGMSYRAGFASLEQVVVALELLYGVDTGIHVKSLKRLSEIVAERSGLPVPPLKPIVGSHAFIRDMPNWVASMLKLGPDSFPPIGSSIAAGLVGAPMRIVWGIRHPTHLLRAKLETISLEATDEQVAEISRRIEARLDAMDCYPIWVTDEEVETLCREVVAAVPAGSAAPGSGGR